MCCCVKSGKDGGGASQLAAPRINFNGRDSDHRQTQDYTTD